MAKLEFAGHHMVVFTYSKADTGEKSSVGIVNIVELQMQCNQSGVAQGFGQLLQCFCCYTTPTYARAYVELIDSSVHST